MSRRLSDTSCCSYGCECFGWELTTVIPCLALDLRKLQCVQNSLMRIVTNTTKYSLTTPVRKTLHWLPIEHHSIFKIALLVYKFLHSGYPKYFVPFLKPRHSVYNTLKAKLTVCSLRSHTLSLQFCANQGF